MGLTHVLAMVRMLILPRLMHDTTQRALLDEAAHLALACLRTRMKHSEPTAMCGGLMASVGQVIQPNGESWWWLRKRWV